MTALTPSGGGRPREASATQTELFDNDVTRSLLDQLLDDSRLLYRKGSDYHALLDFVVRVPNFAPFNAMLLQLQKPGLSYATSAPDWRDRFGFRIAQGSSTDSGELEAESVAYIVCGRNLPRRLCEGRHDCRDPRFVPGHASSRSSRNLAWAGLAARTKFERPIKPGVMAPVLRPEL